MQRTPKKWDLVTDGCKGEPEEYVFSVRKPRSTTVIGVCVRGQRPSFTTVRKLNQREFLEQYQWNSERHLAGTWEPRSTSEQAGRETLGSGDDHEPEH